MGVSPSKRVGHKLSTSADFTEACDDAYTQTVTLSQHAFNDKIPPYQLTTATTLLHHSLSTSFPLISRWLPSPPSSSLIHRSYQQQIQRAYSDATHEAEACLDREEFREFAVRLFAGAVVESVGKEAVVKSVGVLGIFGVGAVTGAGKDLVRAAAGVYAVGVAASAYLSLAG